MTGLEKIIAQIEQEAQQNADAMLAQARAEAEQIAQQAQQQAQEQVEQIENRARQQVQMASESAKSASDLALRRAVLAAKQKLIGEIIDGVHEKILALPDDKYFALLIEIARKVSLPHDGEACFCQKDLDRMPADFAQAFSAAAKGNLEISKQPCAIDGGFVLTYGGVEENCSIEALFYAARERLQDKVQEILFS